MLGTLLSFASAAFFGLNAVSVRRGVLTGSVLQGISVSLALGLPFFLLISILFGSFDQIWQFSTESYVLLAIAGGVHFAFGRYCNIRATQAMGGLFVRPLQQCSVILSLILAIIFLGETLSPLRFLGIVLVIFGPLIMMRDRQKFKNTMQKQNEENSASRVKFIPKYTEGIIFAVFSAFGFGASPVFVRAAIGTNNYSLGVAGAVVSYSAATFIILLVISSPSRIRNVMSISFVSFRWFSFSAILIGISQLMRYTALTVAPVSVVAPIQQTTVIFQVIFSWFINRNHEAFSKWVLIGIFSSLSGAILVSISTDFFLMNLDLPQPILKILILDWP